jgi:hypothetical protein
MTTNTVDEEVFAAKSGSVCVTAPYEPRRWNGTICGEIKRADEGSVTGRRPVFECGLIAGQVIGND